VNDDVMIAVDPHKASNTAAVVDPVTKTVIESARFANTVDGYAQLSAFAARWAQRRWAVEGCHGAGRFLAQRLVADGECRGKRVLGQRGRRWRRWLLTGWRAVRWRRGRVILVRCC